MANERSPDALVQPGGPADERDLVSAIVDTLPVLAWTARPDGSVDYLNRQWLEFTGLRPELAWDWGWLEVTHPDDRQRVLAAWKAALASGQPAEAEIRLRRADGTYVWFLARAVALRDEAGQVRKWYGTSTEIEERWRAEQAVRDSEHNFRQIVDLVPGLIFTTAPDGAVEWVNRPLLEYFDEELEVLKHWKQTDHVHPDDLPRVIDEATRGFASLQAFGYEERLRRHDGVYRRFRLLATPMRSPNGEVVRWYGVLTDIEDQSNAEAELAAARQRLSRAMQIAAVSELAASIAQGVMRPLEGVVQAGSACRQSLAARPMDVAEALSHADNIVRDASAAAEVVRSIRSLFRQEPARREALHLNDTIRQVLELVADELRSSGEPALRLDLQPDLPAVPADRVQVQQVILNLICSALELLERVDRQRRALSIASRSEVEEVVVSIAGSGPGLPDIESAAEAALAGAGGESMRLAVCRSIVQAHGGRLWVTADAPHTLTLAFALPLQPAAPQSQAE